MTEIDKFSDKMNINEDHIKALAGEENESLRVHECKIGSILKPCGQQGEIKICIKMVH